MNTDQPRSGFSNAELRPATAEELQTAGMSGSELYAAKTGRVAEEIDPNLTLKRQLGRYHKLTRPKMSPTKIYKCRQLLESGEDPFLLALYFNADFGAIANIANDVIRCREEATGQKLGRIPTNVPQYLQLAERLIGEAKQLSAEDQKSVEIEAASADVPSRAP